MIILYIKRLIVLVDQGVLEILFSVCRQNVCGFMTKRHTLLISVSCSYAMKFDLKYLGFRKKH